LDPSGESAPNHPGTEMNTSQPVSAAVNVPSSAPSSFMAATGKNPFAM